MKLRIYYLYHPVTGEVKYVGRTTSTLNNRLRDHINGAMRDGRQQKRESRLWIRSLMEEGIKPKICLIEEISENVEDFENAEKKWIAYYKSLGYNLVNSTDGERVSWKMYPDKYREFIIDIVSRIESGQSYRSIEKELNLSKGYIKNLRKGNIAAANYFNISIPETKRVSIRGCGRGWTYDKKRGKYISQPFDSQGRIAPRAFNTQSEAEEYYKEISNDSSYVYQSTKFKPELKQSVAKTNKSRRLQVIELSTGKSIVYNSIAEAVQKLGLRRKSIESCFIGRMNSHRGYSFKRLDEVNNRESRAVVAISQHGHTIPFNDPSEAAKELKLRHECILKCLSGLQRVHKGYRFSFA